MFYATCQGNKKKEKKNVTDDEKYIYYENPIPKKSWVDAPFTSVPRKEIHIKKVLLCIWWDMKGVIYYEFLAASEAATADLYSQQLN